MNPDDEDLYVVPDKGKRGYLYCGVCGDELKNGEMDEGACESCSFNEMGDDDEDFDDWNDDDEDFDDWNDDVDLNHLFI